MSSREVPERNWSTIFSNDCIETYVTKGQMLKRPKFHARGRMGKNYHRFSHIKMVLEEAEELPQGRRDDTTKQLRSKFKNGTVPKDLADFPMDLVFPYRVRNLISRIQSTTIRR